MLKFQVRSNASSAGVMRRAREEHELRLVKLKRSSMEEPFGFAVRGGYEHHLGFYVSHITPASIAEQNDLQIGDEILRINGLNLERAMLPEIIRLVQNKDTLVLRVRANQSVPLEKSRDKGVHWKDALQFNKQMLNFKEYKDYSNPNENDTRGASGRLDGLIVPNEPHAPPPPPPLPRPESLYNSEDSNLIHEDLDVPLPSNLARTDSSGASSSLSSDGSFADSGVKVSYDHIPRGEPAPLLKIPTQPAPQSTNSETDSVTRKQLHTELEVKLQKQRQKLDNPINVPVSKTSSSSSVSSSSKCSSNQGGLKRMAPEPPKVDCDLGFAIRQYDTDKESGIIQRQHHQHVPREEMYTKPVHKRDGSKDSTLSALDRLDRAILGEDISTPGSANPTSPANPSNPSLSAYLMQSRGSTSSNSSYERSAKGPGLYTKRCQKRDTNGLGLGKSGQFPSMNDISNALQQIHATNVDPRLLFSQDQLRGRDVQVMNMSKLLLQKRMKSCNGSTYLNLNGHSQNGLEEVLMIEGHALTGKTTEQVERILLSNKQDTIKLWVARKT